MFQVVAKEHVVSYVHEPKESLPPNDAYHTSQNPPVIAETLRVRYDHVRN